LFQIKNIIVAVVVLKWNVAVAALGHVVPVIVAEKEKIW
jgi:hypothetical protein